ncbi:MAG: transposase [Caldilinea sp. CFX5]|nr:transposase [Caldilinea sp. CFX5]
MRLTYKYRLTPTSAQRTSLDRVLETCRRVYNDTLAIRKDTYEQAGKSLGLYETNKLLTQWKTEKPALKGVHSQVLQNVQERVELAFKAFFRRVKAGETPGYPRFKGYGRYDSFTFKQSGFKLDGDRLTISKVGAVKVKLHRPICGDIKTLTIQRDSVGNWYACFSCECEPTPLPTTHNVVGVDLGLTTFAYFSNGAKIERQRWMKQDAKDIARLQRKKEKFVKGSAERRKVVHALCHAYERAANRRNNFAHQESRRLVNEYQFIAFEKLDIQEMQVNGSKTISRGIADVAWGQFVQFTTYKAANAGRGVALVNPRGTTQECSGCGSLVPKDLSVRSHDCPTCGLKISRDLNAALNILARGLASIGATSVDEAIEAHVL